MGDRKDGHEGRVVQGPRRFAGVAPYLESIDRCASDRTVQYTSRLTRLHTRTLSTILRRAKGSLRVISVVVVFPTGLPVSRITVRFRLLHVFPIRARCNVAYSDTIGVYPLRWS